MLNVHIDVANISNQKLEKNIEKKVCDYAKSKNWLVYKFVSPGHNGVPDRIFIKKGKVFFIEFKRKNKKTTKLQQLTINDLKNNNIDVFVVDSVVYGKNIIDKENSKIKD